MDSNSTRSKKTSDLFRGYFMLLLNVEGFLESLLPSSITRLLIVLRVKRSDIIKGNRKWLMSIERELFGRVGMMEEFRVAGMNVNIIGRDLDSLRDYVWNRKEYNKVPLNIWFALWRPTKIATGFSITSFATQPTTHDTVIGTTSIADSFYIEDLRLPSTFVQLEDKDRKSHDMLCSMDSCNCDMVKKIAKNERYHRYTRYIDEPHFSYRAMPDVKLINEWFKYLSASPIVNLLYLYNPGAIYDRHPIQEAYLENPDIICNRGAARHRWNPNAFSTLFTSDKTDWNICNVNSMTRAQEIKNSPGTTIHTMQTNGIRITFANRGIEYTPDKYESCFIPSS